MILPTGNFIICTTDNRNVKLKSAYIEQANLQ